MSARSVGLGETIVERQGNGRARKVIDITDEHVVCEREGRRTRIKRVNLHRYVIVAYAGGTPVVQQESASARTQTVL